MIKLLKNVRLSTFITVRYRHETRRKIRYPVHRRGIAPYLGKTLDQKLEEANFKDPAVHYKVNIGLPQRIEQKVKNVDQTKVKKDLDLEKRARENKIKIPLEDVRKEWNQESAFKHIKSAAEHYGIFQDLFGDAYFYPSNNLDILFKDGEFLLPVCRGNSVKPSQAIDKPVVSYDAEPDTWWTLVATNPDNYLDQGNAEYLHWFLGNIPACDLSKAQQIADFVQPFPVKGTGFQRFTFILYKQDKEIDYTSLQKMYSEMELGKRIFTTSEFYRKLQDQLTPASLAFCLVDWDFSVSQFFHTVLGQEEPVYEYDFNPPYYKKQKLYPIREAFNLYMDRYRDPKQIAKEYLLMKFKNRHPFIPPKPAMRFPNAVPVAHDLDEKLYGKIPSWLKREKLKQRLGYGRINDY